MRFILLGGLGLVLAAPVRAQSPAPPGVLRGIVYDSLITRAPLEGAEVWIESTNRMARSDAGGRFTLDALSPGRGTGVSNSKRDRCSVIGRLAA